LRCILIFRLRFQTASRKVILFSRRKAKPPDFAKVKLGLLDVDIM
jgi:hypothetical protein